MAIRIWVQGVDPGQKDMGKDIADCLARHGIEVHDIDPGRAGCAGVLLCGTVDGECCRWMRELSGDGQGPVLAGCLGGMSADSAWRLLQAGAADVLECRHSGEFAREIAARLLRWESLDALMAAQPARQLVGRSRIFLAALRQVVEAAHFTDSPVLLLGESGTGKELLARLIHALDPRPTKAAFVVLDCTTIMPELSGSEFFGHERGAFTGAVTARDGAFALADRGTLFLDEVGELPQHLQTQLLRVIQEQSFKRVGGNAWQHTAFRLVCATNRDLEAMVRRGEFRADLYYRLAGFLCRVPPLRDRPDDILPLARHFLGERCPGGTPPDLDGPVAEYLLQRDYPGNVRDLKQVIGRMLCHYPGQGPITVGCVPPDDRPVRQENEAGWCDQGFTAAIRRALAQGVGLKEIGRSAEEAAIRMAVAEAGSLQRAARRLGVSDRTLQMRRAARLRPN